MRQVLIAFECLDHQFPLLGRGTPAGIASLSRNFCTWSVNNEAEGASAVFGLGGLTLGHCKATRVTCCVKYFTASPNSRKSHETKNKNSQAETGKDASNCLMAPPATACPGSDLLIGSHEIQSTSKCSAVLAHENTEGTTCACKLHLKADRNQPCNAGLRVKAILPCAAGTQAFL